MKYAEVAENVKRLLEEPPSNDVFVYELLLAYGTPKATVARLKLGQLNLAKEPGEVLLKKKLWFKPVAGDLLAAIEELKSAKATKANDPRFLIVTDFKQILAVDRKTADTLDVELKALESNFDFFLPWAGMEKTKLSNENPADVKAAEKMAKLFDVIKQDNLDYVRDNPHWMNIFLSRLLFCLFAEDTGIFPKNAMCNAIASYTAVDGADLPMFFERLFEWLDTPDRGRKNLTTESTKNTEEVEKTENSNIEHRTSNVEHRNNSANGQGHLGIRELPYVNGGLFKDHYPVPNFSAKSRRMIIESGTLNWSEINPDIFGSMFQAVIDPEERHNLGQHYTSVTNIMKVIEPLFLNDLKDDLEKAREMTRGKMQALNRLLDRIANVKIFDPACGSGNFLIIAYKELRNLEMAVFKELQTIETVLPLSRMTVSQFYGIEIDDFAHETAILALWLAEHQMNLEYTKIFGQTLVSLPLKEGANVVCGNACRLDWETVCPKNEGDEIYIMGNPPYLGARQQSKEQKSDMMTVFGDMKGVNSLDYIACWFFNAAQYIRGVNVQFAFVSTNSICQGEQVALLWPGILKNDLEISFAHQSFKWANNAKGSAGVTCVIVGGRNLSNASKFLFHGQHVATVENINAYLANAGDLYVTNRRNPISKFSLINYGSFALDDGKYTLTEAEKEELIRNDEQLKDYIRPFVGACELIQGVRRYCLWLENADLKILDIPVVKERVEHVRKWRASSSREATKKLASIPHLFAEVRQPTMPYLAFPTVSSERRHYIPIDYLQPEVVASNQIYVIANAQTYLFGLLSSLMHMVWVRAVAGRLESRIRYSAGICYNTFPIPELTDAQKQIITMHVGEVLTEREKHCEKTMAQLYDPDKMPAGLREAHHQLDLAVDRLYRSKPFTSDEERLEHLFKLYEEMYKHERQLDRSVEV